MLLPVFMYFEMRYIRHRAPVWSLRNHFVSRQPSLWLGAPRCTDVTWKSRSPGCSPSLCSPSEQPRRTPHWPVLLTWAHESCRGLWGLCTSVAVVGMFFWVLSAWCCRRSFSILTSLLLVFYVSDKNKLEISGGEMHYDSSKCFLVKAKSWVVFDSFIQKWVSSSVKVRGH